MRVTSAEFKQNYETVSDQALVEPVTIIGDRRGSLTLISTEEFERLQRRERQVVLLEDFTEEDMALLARSEVPVEYAHLNEELKDWHP